MREYWYCGNIPPRPLDEKEGKDFEMRGKDDRTKFGPIRGGFLEENWQLKKKVPKTDKSVRCGGLTTKEKG